MTFAAQGSPEWFAAREGKLTASVFGAAAGLGPGSRQQLWRRALGLETFEGNPATEYGKQNESVAVDCYGSIFRCFPEEEGFIVHRDHDWLGCSPDILIGDAGLGEVKCPFSANLYDEIPPYYMAQVQGQLEITDRSWCDFICWTPGQMRVWRVVRSESYWDWMLPLLADFWCYVQAQVEPPRRAKPTPPDGESLIIRVDDFDHSHQPVLM